MKKNIFIGLMLTVFGASMIMTLFPQRSLAARGEVSGTWESSAQIYLTDDHVTDEDKVIYQTFVDPSPGNPDRHFYIRGENDGEDPNKCVDSLIPAADNNTATLQRSRNRVIDIGCEIYKVVSVRMRLVDNATKTPEAAASESGETCEEVNLVLSWILCPVVTMLDLFFNFIDKAIQNLMTIEADKYRDPDLKIIWAQVRNIAYIILIPVMLVMVIGTAVGFSAVDAYTVKKALPRLVVAVIFIALSFDIGGFLIGMSNNIGQGALGLMTAPLDGPYGEAGVTFSGLSNAGAGSAVGEWAVMGGLITAGVLIAGNGAMLAAAGLFLISACLTVLTVLLVIIARQLFILAILVLLPIAIIAWIFPGNDKLWKFLWGTFTKLLIMFPLIMVLIGSSRLFAYIVDKPGSSNVFEDNALNPILKLVAYIIPYLLIPFAFKAAGGVLGNLMGMANDKEKGLFDRLKKGRSHKYGRAMNSAKQGEYFMGGSETNRRGWLSRGVQSATFIPKSGLKPSGWRGHNRAARSAYVTSLAGEADKSIAARAVAGNDDLLAASLHGNGTDADARAYLQGIGQRGRELDQNVASITQTRKDMGREAFMEWAAASNAGTGSGYRSGFGEMAETINRVAGSDRARAARILNAARGQAERAKRVDLYGAGFATSADQLSQLYTRDTNAASANDVIADEALNTKSAAEVGAARHGALTNMSGAIQGRLARARANVTAARATGNAATITQAEHEHKRVLAHTASLLDIAGSTSPENAQVIGAIMGEPTGGTTAAKYVTRQARDLNGNLAVDASTNMPVMETVASGTRPETIGDNIERLRTDPEFQQYRREYGSAQSAAAAAAAAGGVPPAGSPPPGAPPAPSDRRLKTQIQYIETLHDGIKLYSFKYIWGGPTHIGVMAQDLLLTHPKAVILGRDGYYSVDYAQLGLTMTTETEWHSLKKLKVH